MKRVAIALTVVLGLVVAAGLGCSLTGGETNAQVFARYAPRFEELRARLKTIAESLPQTGSIDLPNRAGPLAPPPVFDVPGEEFNTAFVMYEEALDPDVEIETPANFTLRLDDANLVTHLRWTGAASPMSSSALNSAARSELAGELERSLNLEYLVVVRTLGYEPPVVAGDAYTGGRVSLEVFLVRFESGEVLAGFPVSAAPESEVMSHFREGTDDPTERGAAFVYSSLWRNAREEVARKLTEFTGGKFEFER